MMYFADFSSIFFLYKIIVFDVININPFGSHGHAVARVRSFELQLMGAVMMPSMERSGDCETWVVLMC